ncbi:MAG: heme-binding domain-containing protein [Pyrinomonadaceae bacterium]
MKILKYIAIGLAVLFLIAQFIRPSFTNPPVNPEERLEASVEVPADVAAILKRSCSDCHTNESAYPWYSKITPVNWWLNHHVEEGRGELNFSVWSTYTPRRKAKKLEEICEEIEKGEMPLPSYLWAHRDATLSADESKLLCSWATSARQALPPTQ